MASKRRVRRHSCERKSAYPDRQSAESGMAWIAREKMTHSLNVYPCRFCGKWHVGHLKIDGADPSGIRKRYR